MAGDPTPPLAPATLAVTAGRGDRRPGGALNVPVTLSSTYHAGGEVPYAREGHPTWSALEEALGALEGGDALVFASGMGAIDAILATLATGATVVTSRDLYSGTAAHLEASAAAGRLGLRRIDGTDVAATAAACADADLLWLESPTNPLLEVSDLAALSVAAHAAGARVVVDNTFATPLRQRPLDLGADVVVHSVTKFIAGHSDVLLGAVVTRDAEIAARVEQRRVLGGAVPGPLETFLALRGLRTLPVRLDRAEASAGELARRLAAHPAVTRVRYPGLPDDPGHAVHRAQADGPGALLAFEVAGGAEAAERACAAVAVVVHTTSLGGVESTMERRARHPGQEHVPPGLVRLSVGCEDVEDLWTDLDAALRAAAPTG